MKRLFAASITLGVFAFGCIALGNQAYAQGFYTSQPIWENPPLWSEIPTYVEQTESEKKIKEIEVSREMKKDSEVLESEVILGTDPVVVPYGTDGAPLKVIKTDSITISERGYSPLLERETSMYEGIQSYTGECVREICPKGVEGAPAAGVSSEMIEAITPFSVDRLSSMPDGSVMVTYSAPFKSDEVLVIDEQNRPVLMTMSAGGEMIEHPTRRAALHENEILLIDNDVKLSDLKDNPFPTAILTENVKVLGPGFEREVALTSSPSHTVIANEDFSRSLPVVMTVSSMSTLATTPINVEERIVTYDRLGNPVMIEVSQPTDGQLFQLPGEIPVAFTSSLPKDWRAITVGNGIMLLDKDGVIRDLFYADL